MNRLLLLFFCSVVVFSCNNKITTIDEPIDNPIDEPIDAPTESTIESGTEESTKEATIEPVKEVESVGVKPIRNSDLVGIELDVLGNKYVYSDIEIVKLSSEGDTLAKFNTRSTSGISTVSASNPNKVIVFSKDNQRSWTLDSTLSVIEDKTIDLPELGVIGMVTRLEGDDILYYSKSNKKFYRTNSNTEKIIESDVQWDLDSEIKDIIESNDQFIVRTEKNEIYLHDSFGNRVKKLSGSFENGPIDFQHNKVFQIINGQLHYMDINDPTAEFKEYKLSGGLKNVSDFKMARQKLFCISNGKVVEQKIMIVNY